MSTGNEDHAVIVHAAVFLNYRVSDTRGIADRLAVELMRAFGPDEVFLDKRSTESGQKWPDHIQHAIESSKVVLVLIGPRWLKAHDEFGERRLNSPEDWVRREVETALAGTQIVIPVLVNDADLPPKEAFASVPSLRTLPECQSTKLREAEWDADVERLVRALESHGLVRSDTQEGPVPEGRRHSALDVRLHRTRYVNYLLVNPATAPAGAPIPAHSWLHTTTGLVGSGVKLEGIQPDKDGHLPHVPEAELLVDFTVAGRGPTALLSRIDLEILESGQLPPECVAGTFRPVLEPIEETVVIRGEQTRYPLFRDTTLVLEDGQVDLLRVDVVIADDQAPAWFTFRFVVTYTLGGREAQAVTEALHLVKATTGPTPRIPFEKRPSTASAGLTPPADTYTTIERVNAWVESAARARQRPDLWLHPAHISALLELADSEEGVPPIDDLAFLEAHYLPEVMGGKRSTVQSYGYAPFLTSSGGSAMEPRFVPVNPTHGQGYATTIVGGSVLYEHRDTPTFGRLVRACHRLSLGQADRRNRAVAFLLSHLRGERPASGFWSRLFGGPKFLDVAGLMDTITLLAVLPSAESCATLVNFLDSGNELLLKHVATVFNGIRYRGAADGLLRLATQQLTYWTLPALASLQLNGELRFFDDIVEACRRTAFPPSEVRLAATVLLALDAHRAEMWARQHASKDVTAENRLAYEILNTLETGPLPTTLRAETRPEKPARVVMHVRHGKGPDEPGLLMEVLGPEPDVVERSRRSVEVFRETMKRRPEEVRDAFAAALQHHATLMFKLRYADEAENAARDEVALCRAHPQPDAPDAALAASLVRLGMILSDSGNETGAAEVLSEARRLLDDDLSVVMESFRKDLDELRILDRRDETIAKR